jgi:hypothetical protein
VRRRIAGKQDKQVTSFDVSTIITYDITDIFMMALLTSLLRAIFLGNSFTRKRREKYKYATIYPGRNGLPPIDPATRKSNTVTGQRTGYTRSFTAGGFIGYAIPGPRGRSFIHPFCFVKTAMNNIREGSIPPHDFESINRFSGTGAYPQSSAYLLYAPSCG